MILEESVVIHNFWATKAHGRPIVFHKRKDPGTVCDSKRVNHVCGHALPRSVAEKIAVPCNRCYRISNKEVGNA